MTTGRNETLGEGNLRFPIDITYHGCPYLHHTVISGITPVRIKVAASLLLEENTSVTFARTFHQPPSVRFRHTLPILINRWVILLDR